MPLFNHHIDPGQVKPSGISMPTKAIPLFPIEFSRTLASTLAFAHANNGLLLRPI